MKIILTGATGMVGEGVLFECIQNPKVAEILIIGRREYAISNDKVKQLIVSDFFKLEEFKDQLIGYEACFFCAGISSVGMKEEQFRSITYDTTIYFAKTLVAINPAMTFIYVSGKGTDSTEKGRTMWARVKGKTENDLNKLGFKQQYNFRPAIMLPFKDQKNFKPSFKFMAKVLGVLFPKMTLKMEQVGKAMINITESTYAQPVLEVKDIRKIAVAS